MATLPISVFVIGMVLSTLPVGAGGIASMAAMQPSSGQMAGGARLLASLALVQASFVLSVIAMVWRCLCGGGVTFASAAECVPAADKPRALYKSLVLAGGVSVGVQFATWSPPP